MENAFTITIKSILEKRFNKHGEDIFSKSILIQYINFKTRSANNGSKSRSSFANLYSIYVIVEDYIVNGFHLKGNYSEYEGAIFNKLLARQRELPFGKKLQNHSLNNRTNSEFQKYFPNSDFIPILRNHETNRYWINENLLILNIGDLKFNIATSIIEIIDEYSKTKHNSFIRFIKQCEDLQRIANSTPYNIKEFINGLLNPNVDARLFEIISYCILKFYYHDQNIFWGFDIENLNHDNLKLYKTGRTNANGGGIDFVMKPLGRFFQVTENLDFRKYFLDIDKVQKYPITFVIKSSESTDEIFRNIREKAEMTFKVNSIVDKYMNCIEEIINIPILKIRFDDVLKKGYLNKLLNEIVIQSKLEFNFE